MLPAVVVSCVGLVLLVVLIIVFIILAIVARKFVIDYFAADAQKAGVNINETYAGACVVIVILYSIFACSYTNVHKKKIEIKFKLVILFVFVLICSD